MANTSETAAVTRGARIVEIQRDAAGIDRFIKLSYSIYKYDPNWVAPLRSDLKLVFSNANPFFQHADAQLWIAEVNGRDVGRLAGIIDHSFNDFQKQAAAFFGFFECINDASVSSALFAAAESWARERGMTTLIGPMSPSTNDECGLLVDGFDSPPVVMMPYNPRYYVDLVAAFGFEKTKDLLAFYVKVEAEPGKRLDRLAAAVRRRRPNLSVRPITKRTLDADLPKVKEIYNAAWENNWGFVPLTDAEIDFLAMRLKPLLTSELAWIIETPEEPVAFMLGLPDFNEALKPLRGTLMTPRLLQFLPYLFGWKTPRLLRLITLGVKEPYRLKGLESVMFSEALKYCIRRKFVGCEGSWVLEDNVASRGLFNIWGGVVYKTYRLFQKPL